MTPGDLATLHGKAFPADAAWSERFFMDLLVSDAVFLIENPHSFALGRVAADEAELLTLATDPAHQRQGLARDCLLRFEAKAAERGAITAFLEVGEDNHSARRLYAAAGFQETARRESYYQTSKGPKVAALLLRKPLKSVSCPGVTP